MADETEKALAESLAEQCQECGTGLIVGRCYRCNPRPGRNDSWVGVVFGTDWLLLRGQKQALLTVLGEKTLAPDLLEYLEGILNFIDAVQDAAAADTDEFTVFGKREE